MDIYILMVKIKYSAPNGATRINDENHLLVTIGANGNYLFATMSNNGVVVNKAETTTRLESK